MASDPFVAALRPLLTREGLLACAYGVALYILVMSYPGLAPNHNLIIADALLALEVVLALSLLRAHQPADFPDLDLTWGGALAGAMLISTLSAVATGPWAWDRLQLYFAAAALGVLLTIALRPRPASGALALLLAICGVQALILLAFVVFHAPAIAPTWNGDEIVPGFNNRVHYGMFAAVAACAALGVGLLRPAWRAWSLALLAAALASMLVLGLRGALIGWLCGVACAALALPRTWRAVGRDALLALVAAAVLATAYLGTRGPEQSDVGASNLLSRASEGRIATASRRGEIWADALAAGATRPLFGWGPEGYMASRCCRAGTAHPHNALVQAFVEFGLVGTLLMAGVLLRFLVPKVRALAAARRRGAEDLHQALSLALTGCLLVLALVDGVFYHGVPLILVATVAALVASAFRPAPG